LVEVLPTEPVTATIFAVERARAAAARSRNAASTSSTAMSRASSPSASRKTVDAVARDHREATAGLQRGGGEIMAVMDIAFDGKIGLARRDGPAVD